LPQNQLPSGPWLRRDVRAAPVAVWAALVLHLLLLLTYTTLQPAYRGLDEAAHIDMVLTVANPFAWPGPGDKDISADTAATYDEASHDGLPFARLARDDAQQPKGDRPAFGQAGQNLRPAETNQMVQHPPLYYLVVAAGDALVPGADDWPYDRRIALLRLLSLLMVAPLPLLCWLGARRLGAGTTTGAVAAFIPLTMPSVQRVGSSVSNDALLVVLIGAVNVLAIVVAGGDLRRRTAVALGLLSAAAILTKGTALILPFVVVLAYAVAAYRRRALGPVLIPGLITTVLIGGLSGWWYVRNLLLHGAVQPNGYAGGVLPYPKQQGGGVGEWGPDYVRAMLFRFWSALGQPEPPGLPNGLATGLTLTLLALVVVALAVTAGRRLLVAVALLPFAGTLALVALGSYVNYQAYDRFIGVQGRYLYPALVGLAVAAAVALSRLLGPARRILPLLVLGLAALVQYLAAEALLETYWTTPEALAEGFVSLEAWSPLPSVVVRALWVATVLAGAATAAAAARLLLTALPPAKEPARPQPLEDARV